MKKSYMIKGAGMTAMAGLVLLSACGEEPANENVEATTVNGNNESDEANEVNEENSGNEELIEVGQVTNWYAQAEQGGQFAAHMMGFYEDEGLDMTIQAGGGGVSNTQLVASGQQDFGMGSSDEILLAREDGIPLVAIAGIFQQSPQALMFHKGQDIEDFTDLNGRDVYVSPGAGFWEFMKGEFDLDVNEYSYTGDSTMFMENEEAVSQSYMTSEPYGLEQQGVEVDWLLNGESGFEVYGNLLFTTEEMIEEQPEVVQAYVEASVAGWEYYKDNHEEVQSFIQEYNPEMSTEQLAYSAEALQPLVYEYDAEDHGVGYMTEERWQSVMKILLDIDLLTEEQDVTEAFNTEFLPQ
ncbi:ABC transporter substrate-binding protein [Salisediminibacterium beveridgei]|uniref:ABC transporter substrate binding protein n=1 Tax=Salisediminibacterium beveridgei TaxID=632773 RepID=A0A1D7QYI2_9BACI|nr:ABC transporter substrate-binding protein [Salisediminibacterium beveridgei]AOM84038.1 ABC transporter substrate binding protein [Salisediminibacterium beveridgei]